MAAHTVDQVAADLKKLFDGTNAEFSKIEDKYGVVQQDVKEFKDNLAKLHGAIQANVVTQLENFKVEMQLLETNAKSEFLNTKA